MKVLGFALLLVIVGCSTAFDVDKKLDEYGITRPESKNFLKAVVALSASCKQSDSRSIQVCQFYNEQSRSIPNVEQFLKTALFTPDALNDTQRESFNRITLIGAGYREYLGAQQANADSERFWNSFAAGAAFGTLFSRPNPAPQLNCQMYGSGNYQWGQCQ